MKNSNPNSIKQKMGKILLTFLITSLTILTIVICLTFINRLTMPYNSEGNYFEENSCVVYHQQSVIFYGILIVLFLFLTIFSVYKIIRK